MQTVFDFTVPGSAVSYRRSTGAGFVDAAALQDAPRLHTPQMAANWQPMWWYGGWCAGFAAGPRGVAASPAPCLPAADLAGRELPVWFRADLPGEGTYQVSLRLCGRGGPVRVFAGRRRLMWQGTLTEGQVRELRFPLDVTPLVPDGETQPALNAAADLAVTGADLQAVCLQPAAMPRVFLMGDSTVTDQCAGLPYAPGSSYAGWGQMLGRFLPGDWCVSNHAHSGLTTESFTEGGHWAIVEPRLRAGDFCLLQFGHNDQKLPHLAARGGYTERLRGYLRAIRTRGAQPVLVTPLARNTWTADGRYNDLLAEYAAAVFDLGRQEQVPVIDLHGYAMEGICAEGRERSKRWFYPGDYTHTNDFGACRFAAFVAGRLCALAGRPAPAVPVREPSGPMLPLTPPADAAPTGETPFAVYETQQPDAPLTRADALCQITATLKLFPVNGYKSPFADVVGQAPFAGAVQSAVQSGLIPEHWTADGCLHPGQSVTLAEFLEMLRPGYAARRPLPAGAVADQAVQAGWIDAGADLNGVLTRAQGAAICRRVQI